MQLVVIWRYAALHLFGVWNRGGGGGVGGGSQFLTVAPIAIYNPGCCVSLYYVMFAHTPCPLLLQHSFLCSNKMPEGPELHLASLYVNKMCNGVVFTGPVRKSEVSKSPDVPFTCEAYRITATSRGKEVKLTLTPMKSDDTKRKAKKGQADQPMDVVFRFGMSGYFRFTTEDELPKHAHLRFYSTEKPCRVLSFVDARRFGSWQHSGTWQPSRGPCIMFEYKSFRFVMKQVRVSRVSSVQLYHCLANPPN